VQSLFHVQMKIVKYSSFLSPTIEFISAMGVAITLVYAYYARIEWNTFLSIVFALFVSYEPVKNSAPSTTISSAASAPSTVWKKC